MKQVNGSLQVNQKEFSLKMVDLLIVMAWHGHDMYVYACTSL